MRINWVNLGVTVVLIGLAWALMPQVMVHRRYHGFLQVRAVRPESVEADAENERVAALLHPLLLEAGLQLSEETPRHAWKYYGPFLLIERHTNQALVLHFRAFNGTVPAKRTEERILHLLKARTDLEVRRLSDKEYFSGRFIDDATKK